jgi:Flp pilus assembly protein TadD
MNMLLDVEPLNIKALYLRGRAYYHLNEIESAYQDLIQAYDLEPQNEVVNRYLNELTTQYPELEN